MPVENGNLIKIEYEGKLEDGTVFDSSAGREPLQFQVGAHQVIPGFEESVLGMNEGEEKDVTIEKDKAYGDPNPQLVQKVPKEQLPAEQEPQVGMMIGVQLPTGQQLPAKIAEVTDSEVTLDLNHPLAGKTLHFHIKVVEIAEGQPMEEESADSE